MNRTSTHYKRTTFSFLEGAFWPAMCASYLLIIILQDRGFTNTQAGMVLSINATISVLIQPLWGMLSDFLRSTRKTF